MARNWTQAQQQAIEARDGTLLVSAAAGSGKTAVLVQRVIERLTDPLHPSDADRLLVVTFTNAAAAEMRERIGAAIDELLIQDPYNARLQRQQILLARAHISTIHSFCSEMVRENFYKLNISPDFRISDDNEMTVLREEAMRQVMEEGYAEGGEAFRSLSDAFGAGRDDSRLLKTVETLYDFVRSHPFPDQWLAEKEAMYHPQTSIAQTIWGKTILDYAASAVDYCISLTANALELLGEDPAIDAAYRPAFSSDFSALLALKEEAETGTWDSLRRRFQSFSFEKLKPLRGYQENTLKAKISGNREQVKKTLGKLNELFSCDEEQCREDISRMAPLVEQLFSTVRRFAERLDKLKAQRRAADFGDLEHWMLRLLVHPTEDGYQRTEEAEEIARQFDEVMVDEYQDTNEAQDMIFRAVSRGEENLFMVGDVKQSIYRFRQAMPEIFLRRKASYQKYNSIKKQYPARVTLDRNFRSRAGVTDAVNFVFHQLMSKQMGEMAYTEEEELVPGAVYPPKAEPDTCLYLMDLSKWDTDDMDAAEARHIAQLIAGMIGSGRTVTENGVQRPVTYRDFCILLRSASKHACVYAKQLQQYGISAWSDTAGSFFGTPEIAVMLSLLRVLDNPVQDIPLLSVLMSPIYGFIPDDLSDIRVSHPNGALYFAVKAAADQGNHSCLQFLQDMEHYRQLAATMPADQLINYLYEHTGYLAIVQAMKEGELRRANLRLLLEYARTYESSGYKGLAGFIRFIDRLEQQNADLSPATVLSESANVVRVMSIHRSKGLEFPICIVAGCARRFNQEKKEVLLHPALGLGIKLWDEAMTRRYTTMPREAVALELERGGLSEELRVLYVAMTRAKEQLVLLTSLKDPVATLGKLGAQLTEAPAISPYVVRGAGSFSDWLLLCALRHPSGGQLRELAGTPPGIMLSEGKSWDIQFIYPALEKEEKNIIIPDQNFKEYDEPLLHLMEQRLQYTYPADALRGIPTKIAASELANKRTELEYAASTRPAFLSGQSLTPAEKGTALHAFMQFADYREAAQNPEVQLQRLIERGFLTPEQGKAVDLEQVRAFFNSPILHRILKSQHVMREYRFTVTTPAKELRDGLPQNLQEEPVILQGAVDCAFEEDGALVIVDYKTDRVKDPQQLKDRYTRQLELYAQALTRCTGLKIKECLLYSFDLGGEIIV